MGFKLPGVDKGIAGEAWRIAWPLMVAEAVDSVLSFIDTFFVSRLGDTAVAAVGLAGYVSWLFFVVTSLYYVGSLVTAAQAYGGRRLEEAARFVGESLTASMIVSIPVAVLAVYAAPWLLGALAGRAGPNVVSEAVGYLVVRVTDLPLLAAAMVAGAAYRAVGETKPALTATTLSAAVNAVLDPPLIYGVPGLLPALGVRGAALASVIASGVALLAYLAMQSRLPFPIEFALPGSRSLRAAWLGLPAMVERLVFAAGNTVYISAVAGCGEAALAAHTIGLRIESIAYLPSFALSVAATGLVGQSVGAGGIGRAKRVGWEVVKMNAWLMTVLGIVLVVSAPLAPRIFTSSPETAKLSTLYLILAGLSEPALAVAMTASSGIRGAGNTLIPMLVNVTGLYGLRVTLAYTLPGLLPPDLCPLGAWLAMDIDLAGRAVASAVIYRMLFEKLARKVA